MARLTQGIAQQDEKTETAPGVVLDLPSIAVSNEQLPTMEARPPFYLCYHPKRWHVEEGELLPDLRRISFRVGANRMRATEIKGVTTYHTEEMVADLARQGYRVIPWDVDGPGTAYLRKCPGRPDVWLAAWETPHPGSPVVSVDHAASRAWRRALVAKGAIPACEPHVREALVQRLTARASKAAESAAVSPRAAQRLARAEAAVAVVEASNV